MWVLKRSKQEIEMRMFKKINAFSKADKAKYRKLLKRGMYDEAHKFVRKCKV